MMQGLFDRDNIAPGSVPLARRMRPEKLEDYAGQEHILGEGKILRRAIDADRISSLILYGPPGCGKNALAGIIANRTSAVFTEINAVLSGVDDIRKVTAEAKERRSLSGKKTIVFIDEIHRFNKAQQDALLPDVENGVIILVGATTQNPYFYINAALISRSIVVQLEPLGNTDIKAVVKRAVADKEKGLGYLRIDLKEDALEHLVNSADGDARSALNALELGVLTSKPDSEGIILFDLAVAEESIRRKKIVYDKDGDEHYNTISAFIKSMRGSDPDAAIYYLAKMLYAGEDPRFIARRIVICAAEDVGNADPQALILANAALSVSEFVGMPEARIPLAQAVVYICCAPKSNSSYAAIDAAMAEMEKKKTLEIPRHLRSTGYSGAKQLGHGEGYKYAHDHEGHFVKQQYIPQARAYYKPTTQGYEAKMKAYLETVNKPVDNTPNT